MYSAGFVMRLKPDGYAGYKKAHDELWPDIARSMSDHGVSMTIYRHGEFLFLFACAPTEADWDASRQYPILAEWTTYMREFLADGDDGELLFEPLEEAFVFGMFDAEGLHA
jgi:L-rhamnose mutarotase